MIKIKKNYDGLFEIYDSVLEENGWLILGQKDGTWALFENLEFMEHGPFKIYSNHFLDEAIAQGKKWT